MMNVPVFTLEEINRFILAKQHLSHDPRTGLGALFG